MNDAKLAALCGYLGCEPDDLKEESYDHYGLELYAHGNKSYAIGTEKEVNEAAKSYIEGSIWAFNASFILQHCDLPLELEDAIRFLQEKKCEDANDALLALVNKCGDLDTFVEKAISSDSRAHFLSTYDGDENESGDFYIYRTN